MNLEITMIQFSVTSVTSEITPDALILTLNNTKNWRKIHCPGTFQTVQWKYLSTLSNKGLKISFLEAPLKLYLNHCQKRFTRKLQKSLKHFMKCQLFDQLFDQYKSHLFDQSENSVSFDYYMPYELNKIKVKQEDLSV